MNVFLYNKAKIDNKSKWVKNYLAGPLLILSLVVWLSACRSQATQEQPTQFAAYPDNQPVVTEIANSTLSPVPTVSPMPPTPTATIEPTPTPDPILRVVGMSDLTEEERQEIIRWTSAADINILDAPEQFRVINPFQIEIVGELETLDVYQQGDVIVKINEANALVFSRQATVSDGLEILLGDTYELTITDKSGQLVSQYMAGETVISWVSKNSDDPTYIFAEFDGFGEPIEQFVTVEQYQFFAYLYDARTAFPDQNIVTLEYNDDLITAYNAEDAIVATRTLGETEWIEWEEVVDQDEWIFGPEERVASLLEGVHELPNTMVLATTIPGGTWKVLSLDSPDAASANPNNVRFLTPDEFYQRTKNIINGALTTAILPPPGLGTNAVLHKVTAMAPIDSFVFNHQTRTGISFEGFRAYTYSIDSDGNIILVLFDTLVLMHGEPNTQYRHFGSLDNSGEVIFQRTTEFPYPSVDDFVANFIADPENPNILYMFENRPRSYSGFFSGEVLAAFDRASSGGNGIDLSQVTNPSLFVPTSPFIFSGLFTAPNQ